MADETRVREIAHRLWEQEGRPEGRENAHWEMARELAAIEENQRRAIKPNPVADGRDRATTHEPVEPVIAVENQGEFPVLNDQGEKQTRPGSSRQRRT
jgi:hypothetical protein